MGRTVIRDSGLGLGDAERDMIHQARNDATEMMTKARKEIEEVWDQKGRMVRRRRRRRRAWSRNDLLVQWFGKSRRSLLLRRLRRRMRRIHRWLRRARIVFIAQDGFLCNTKRAAFTIGFRRPLKIHLCQAWFEEKDADFRAAIIIHELVHELGFGHPNKATTPDQALALAKKSSRKARRSPVNYEQYCFAL